MGVQNPYFRSQEALNEFIDGCIQHMLEQRSAQPTPSSTVNAAESRSIAESQSTDNSSVNKRFDRFVNESMSDVVDVDMGGQ